MCVVAGGIESKPVSLTNQNDPKQSCSFPANLKYRPHGLIAANNYLYRTIKKKVFAVVLWYKMLNVQKRINADKLWYPIISLFGHQQIDTVIFKLFSCTMHCTFHCVFSLSNFQVFFYQSHSKVNDVNQAILLCFKRLTIHQFNVQTTTADNEEQDTLSNMISIHFQNCHFFLGRLLWVNKLHIP